MLLAAVALLGASSWSASLASEVRGRSEPDDALRGEVAEGVLRASLGVATAQPDWSAAVAYTPDLMLRQLIAGSSQEPGDSSRQAGRLSLAGKLAPATTLALENRVDWGLTDFSPLSGAQPAVVPGVFPQQRFVHTLGIDSTVGVEHGFDPSLSLAVSGGYRRSGGADHDAVQVLPMQAGPVGAASLRWAAARGSTLALRADGSQSRFAGGRQTASLANVQSSWAVALDRENSAELAAGATWVRTVGAEVDARQWYASGALGYGWEHALDAGSTLRASARAALVPGVDPLTAQPMEGLRGTAAVELSSGELRASLAGAAGRIISGPETGTRDGRVEFRLARRLGPGWDLEAATAAAWTNQAPLAGWMGQATIGIRWTGTGSF